MTQLGADQYHGAESTPFKMEYSYSEDTPNSKRAYAVTNKFSLRT